MIQKQTAELPPKSEYVVGLNIPSQVNMFEKSYLYY